jgi:hypothetical protein
MPLPSSGSTGGCGWFDFTCDVTHAITSWFAGLVTSAVNPLLSLIGETALSTPQPGSIPAVSATWTTSVAIADVLYVLLVLAGGILVMSHETLQTSYSAKEIAPRVVCGFIFANLSMVLMTQAITLANALSAALAGHGITPGTAAKSLIDTLASTVSSGGIFLVILTIAGVILAVILAFIYVRAGRGRDGQRMAMVSAAVSTQQGSSATPSACALYSRCAPSMSKRGVSVMSASASSKPVSRWANGGPDDP